jgi:hypothetical protein
MGHLMRIANQLFEYTVLDAELYKYVADHPEWEQFVKTTLKNSNEQNNIEFGGFNPKTKKKEPGSEQELKDQEHVKAIPKDQAFGEVAPTK